jgi:predicted nucleotidyltransferase
MPAQFSKQQAIEEITRRLVEFYRPVRIYLFGSEARGDAGPDSDLDFLVVVPDDAPEDRLSPGAGRRAVRGTGFAKDIVPWRRADFEERAAWVRSSLPATVVREGRLLYEALSGASAHIRLNTSSRGVGQGLPSG